MSDAPPPRPQPPEGTQPGWPPPGGPPPVSAYPPPYPYYRGAPQAPSSRGTAGWIVGGCAALAVVLLAGCVVTAIALGRIVGIAVHRVSSAVTVQTSTSQQFALSGAPHLVVEDPAGSVVVRRGADDTVSVDATLSAAGASSAEAQRALDGLSVSATQSGNTVTVHTSITGSRSLFFPRSIALVISVPPTSNLDVTLGQGDVTVSDLTGVIRVAVLAGDCSAQGITLQDGSRLQVTGGSLLFDGSLAPGATVAVAVQRGDATLTLPGATATHIAATTSAGSISITGWSLPVQQQGSVASVSGDLGSGGSGSLTVTVTSGDIVLTAR